MFFLYCETYLVTVVAVEGSGTTSFVDGGCAQAATGDVEVAVPVLVVVSAWCCGRSQRQRRGTFPLLQRPLSDRIESRVLGKLRHGEP